MIGPTAINTKNIKNKYFAMIAQTVDTFDVFFNYFPSLISFFSRNSC